MSDNIARVLLSPDDNVPEYMAGICRVGSVISYDENDNQIKDYQEFVDNAEFYSEEEMVESIAKRLNVDSSIIELDY